MTGNPPGNPFSGLTKPLIIPRQVPEALDEFLNAAAHYLKQSQND